jgi:acylphosphatase
MTRRAARISVRGLVQGVGFRYFCRRQAHSVGLVGWARNCSDGSVEIWAEGESSALEQFIADLRLGPANARVESTDVLFGDSTGDYHTFEITH